MGSQKRTRGTVTAANHLPPTGEDGNEVKVVSAAGSVALAVLLELVAKLSEADAE